MRIYEFRYCKTNTYLIEASKGCILFDTGWAGTLSAFIAELSKTGREPKDIRCLFVSHFHPDHMGIAQEIADRGPKIVIADVQKPFLHAADEVLQREPKHRFVPIRDEAVNVISLAGSRPLLKELGIDGEIIHTPGHSDDSISLILDSGDCFVGDLNPLYELELHKGTEIGESWQKILKKNPKRIYYGHAKTAVLSGEDNDSNKTSEAPAKSQEASDDLFALVKRIMKLIDKGMPLAKIASKTGAGEAFVTDVARMYLTHRNVGVQGILDRIEIKNR